MAPPANQRQVAASLDGSSVSTMSTVRQPSTSPITPFLSTSPSASFHSPASSFGGAQHSRAGATPSSKQLKPFATEDIRILLLENVNETGKDILESQGYQVESLKTSLAEDELIKKIR